MSKITLLALIILTGETTKGLFPEVFNIATGSIITVNATCGETGPEVYCKLVEHLEREPQCGVCDATSANPDKRHPISKAIDGSNNWWQSPTLQNGKKYEWVTVTLDLRQVYQVAYVIVKSANSPLPGNWILEKSVDGIVYKPWQYYAISDTECWEQFTVRPTIGHLRYRADDEVICTSSYSKLDVLEDGEIHTSLVNGRPGADEPSDTLREFTKARFIRLRLRRIRTLNADLMAFKSSDPEYIDKTITRRYFYTLRDISVGGQCLCNGHANACHSEVGSLMRKCRCDHNTCGSNCEKCCPLFGQKPWKPGTKATASVCEACQCYGHADDCYYDQSVADRKSSLNAQGVYEGGGVCLNCKHHTSGVNCEQCEDGYYRPLGVAKEDPNPCRECQCQGPGTTSNCVKDDSHLIEGLNPGDCICKEGFTGRNCEQCAPGFRNYPRCEPCPCNHAGVVNSDLCGGPCVCKPGVEGTRCDRCKKGSYNLAVNNPEGCSVCYCFGATTKCKSSDWGIEVYRNMDGWLVSDIDGQKVIEPDEDVEDDHLIVANDDMGGQGSYYWDAPQEYLGQKLYSYGGDLKFVLSYVVARGDLSSGFYTEDADVILEGGPKNLKIGYNWNKPSDDEKGKATIILPLREQGWFRVTSNGKRGNRPVTREEFTLITNSMKRLLIRAKFHTDQIEGGLHQVDMEGASNTSGTIKKMTGAEQCDCPPGYAGLSCELCASGYRRVNNTLVNGKCEKCGCNGHAATCELFSGKCSVCLHHTTGANCERCEHGYYGNPLMGTPEDCQPCACPLLVESNNFSPSCIASTKYEVIGEAKGYICTQCPRGYMGDMCERCADGYFGNPGIPGGRCTKCDCGPNVDTSQPGWCDHLTGQCAKCRGTTGGDCRTCLPRHVLTDFGCKLCEDECIDMLLDDLDFLRVMTQEANLTGIANLPKTRLLHLTSKITLIRDDVNRYQYSIEGGKRVMANVTFNFDLETLADILYLKARDIETKAGLGNKNAVTVGIQAEELLDLIDDLLDELKRIIDSLRRYGHDTTGPGYAVTDRMLQEAERILRELLQKNFGANVEAERELRKARQLLDRVRQLLASPGGNNNLRERLERLRKLLSDIITIVQEKVQQPTLATLRLVQEGRQSYLYILGAVDNSTAYQKAANSSINEARRLLELAKVALIEAAVQFGLVPRIKDEVDNATQQVEIRRSILARLNPEYADKYVRPCQSHILELQRLLDNLNGLFNATREVSQYPLQAARVYQQIVDALVAAEEAAKRAYGAAERAYREAYPGTDESLIKQAQRAKERSYELLEMARSLRDKQVPELERDLAKKRFLLETVAEDLFNGDRNLELINRALDGLPKGLGKTLKEADIYLRNLLEGLADIHGSVDDIDLRIQDELLPKLERLKAGSASGLENLTKVIEKARSDIRAASRIASNAEDINERVNKLHNQMELNLKELRDRILLARQKASSIKVSLGTSKGQTCVRSFQSEVQPSTTNNIILNYAIKDEARDALLFFISSATTDDFMAIEMVDRKMRFLWNAGGGSQVLQHNLNIETNDPHLLKDNQWYKIEVVRIGNVATLTVKRTPDGDKPDAQEVTGSSPPNHFKMDMDANASLFVGGLPSDFRSPRELRSRTFAGCMYEVIVDGKQIGLWNFKTNEGCHGCKEGATEPKDPATIQFKGDNSYAVLPQIKRYDKRKYLVALQFKTFDEDALLFFSPNPSTGDYVSLTMREGKINYQFNMGSTSRLNLVSKLKYNTGQWVRLAAERDRFEGILSVDDELLEGKVPTGGPTALELSTSEMYYGGVPPNFSATPWPSVTFKPFLGCMKDLQIDTTPLGLLNSDSYGVDIGCREKAAKVVTFKGTGYLELKSQPLREEADFSFTFKTTQTDALLLLSTFQGQTSGPSRDSHYYSVAIVGGLLEARFNGGTGETPLISELRVNDGAYHTVTVSKRHRRISMTLDDVEIGASRLARGTRDIEAPTEGGLILGGLPRHMTLRGMAGTKEPLKGVIRDFVFNRKPLKLNEPVNFEGVGIGRETDDYTNNGYDNGDRIQSMPAQLLETCAEMPQYMIEKRAVKFGDSLRSHITLSRGRNEFTRDFYLTFEFRTYYPNGLFLLIRGRSKKITFGLGLMLRDEKVVVDVREKRQLEITAGKGLNDGKWHNVTISKEERRLWLKVDGEKRVESKVRRKMPLRSPIFLGGIPDDFELEKGVVGESFKGCIRNFHINNGFVDLTGGMTHNVNHCFTRIERGAYFPGDAHAIFDDSFDLGLKLDTELEFKTTRLNGVLISLTNKSKEEVPSLSVELFNGQIVASVDLGEGPIRAEKEFGSAYDMCDGKWHLVKVQYTKSSILVKVDAYEVVYGLPKDKNKTRKTPLEGFARSPLYIGGLPELASGGTLKQRDNFVGCLRNLEVNEKRVDWIDMKSLHNVLPNSCPTY